MAKLSTGTVVVNPSTGMAESLLAGADVPDWAVSQVGDHLLATEKKPADTSSKK